MTFSMWKTRDQMLFFLQWPSVYPPPPHDYSILLLSKSFMKQCVCSKRAQAQTWRMRRLHWRADRKACTRTAATAATYCPPDRSWSIPATHSAPAAPWAWLNAAPRTGSSALWWPATGPRDTWGRRRGCRWGPRRRPSSKMCSTLHLHKHLNQRTGILP